MNTELIEMCEKALKNLKKQFKKPYDEKHKEFIRGQILVYELMLIHLK
jgi:hypothetical protein